MRCFRALQLVAVATLFGCSQLPLDGPTPRDIVNGASAVVPVPSNAVVYDYALVDVNQVVLDCLVDAGADSFLKTFGRLAGSGRPPAVRVGSGDVLQVSVFETAQEGLFQSPAPSNGGRNFVSFPNQTVSSAGSISVPYAGLVHIGGRTLSEIEREIQSKLEKRALEPQVIITMVEQNKSAVTVIGDAVNAGNKLKLTGSGERILDMVSKAGGIRFPGFDVFVTLQRRNRLATMHFPMLMENPQENIFVEPGDVIYVYRDQRKYVALGAIGATSGAASLGNNNSLVGAVGQFSFDQEHLSLNEAIAKAGGLVDSRADPAQVFLFRMERRETLERMGVDLIRFPPAQSYIPTVYRANFRDPSSFLFAQRFPMRNKDTIYVGNSDFNELVKVYAYVASATSTMSTVTTDLNIIWHHGP